MPIDFPNTPVNGQTYVVGGTTWTFVSATNSWEAGPTPYPAYDNLTGTANSIQFNAAPSGTIGIANLRWDAAETCLSYGLEGGDISIGKEMFDTYTDIVGGLVEGDVVSIANVAGNRKAVKKTDATDPVLSANCVGMVTNVNSNGTVRVTSAGDVHSLTTTGMNEGQVVYVNPALPGKITQVKPTAPNSVVVVGSVVVAQTNNGIVNVRVHAIPRLQDLSSVLGSPSINGHVPVWNSAGSYWAFTSKVSDFASASHTHTSADIRTDANFSLALVGSSTFSVSGGNGVSLNAINGVLGIVATNAATVNIASASGISIGGSAITFPASTTFTFASTTVSDSLLTAAGGTTVGRNLFKLTNPSAISIPVIAADNSVTAQTPSVARTTLGSGAAGDAIFQATTYTGVGSVKRLMGLDTTDAPSFATVNFTTAINGSDNLRIDPLTYIVGGGAKISFVNGAWYAAENSSIVTEGPGLLAIRSGVIAQTLKVYNTYTSSTNNEYGAFRWLSNDLRVGTAKGSVGGTARDLVLETDAVERLRVKADGSTVQVAGHFQAATKSFVVPNPLKPGRCLQYGCVEAPEHSVMIRGRTTSTLIQLPTEWSWLVDPSSISVHLTAYGCEQRLYVKHQTSTYIEVIGATGEYSYTVMAERADVPRIELDIEQEGGM